MKKKLVLGLVVLLSVALAACGSKQANSQSSNISFVKSAQSHRQRIWYYLSSKEKPSKYDVPDSIYVTQNGKISSYLPYGQHAYLGDFGKMSDTQIVDKVKAMDKTNMRRNAKNDGVTNFDYVSPKPFMVFGKVKSSNGSVSGEQLSFKQIDYDSRDSYKMSTDNVKMFYDENDPVFATKKGVITLAGKKYGYLTFKPSESSTGVQGPKGYLFTKLNRNQNIEFDSVNTKNVSD